MKRMDPIELVERQLRDECRGIRQQTAFSPLLHERVMAQLRAGGLPLAGPSAPRRGSVLWRIAFPAGVAAAIAAGAWIALHAASESPAPKMPIAKTAPVTIPISAPVWVAKTDLATGALEQRKYALLDRDASRLFTFVADQIPNFPAPRK